MDRVYIMVPVFNEAPNIPTLFGAFRELQSQLSGRLEVHYLLVDDGSVDVTSSRGRVRELVLGYFSDETTAARLADEFRNMLERLES